MEAGTADHVWSIEDSVVLLRTVVSLIALVVTIQSVSATQDSPESLILGRAVEAAQKAEPEWRFVPAILNAPPLMDEELGAVAGSWESSSDPSAQVIVDVYTIATVAAATRFLHRQAHGGVSNGWKVATYKAGDGANMSTYPDPRGFTQYNVTIRKGRFVLMVSGRSEKTIKRFANILIRAISN